MPLRLGVWLPTASAPVLCRAPSCTENLLGSRDHSSPVPRVRQRCPPNRARRGGAEWGDFRFCPRKYFLFFLCFLFFFFFFFCPVFLKSPRLTSLRPAPEFYLFIHVLFPGYASRGTVVRIERLSNIPFLFSFFLSFMLPRLDETTVFPHSSQVG
ncbi:hypothetical protein LX36DRAFT_419055 [Colletotrichum falcatum]|nr:hypothetical protein LX36DRAFT_419055 [Colletotrichum falcatum]